MASVHDFEVESIKGQKVKLSSYTGKVLLIVNTASKCGFTPQYEGLEALQKKYSAKGFEVLGFPCNQFGGQEPGSNADIASFCDLTYKTSFPMFAKLDVNGAGAHPSELEPPDPLGGLGHWCALARCVILWWRRGGCLRADRSAAAESGNALVDLEVQLGGRPARCSNW